MHSAVDEMVVGMKLATPTEGLIFLSSESNPSLFAMAKVGLGSLGVVTELTLRCIPKHSLMEQLSVVDVKNLSVVDHYQRLKDYRHVRYLWLPFTSNVRWSWSCRTLSYPRPLCLSTALKQQHRQQQRRVHYAPCLGLR